MLTWWLPGCKEWLNAYIVSTKISGARLISYLLGAIYALDIHLLSFEL